MKRFDGVAPWARNDQAPILPEGTELERTQPSRPAELGADVIVPLGQAMITGALGGGVATLLLAGLSPHFSGNLLHVWAAVALAVATLTWLVLLRESRSLLWGIERLTRLDLDRDGTAGKPAERLVLLNAGMARQEAAEREKAERVSDFARFVRRLPAKGTALRAWEGEIGRADYQEYRDVLIRLGWARWNSIGPDGEPNERQGWELVMDAGDILKRIG
jgi:hypothetical protein